MVGGATPSSTGEFPPLLPAGIHPFTLAEFRGLCVDGFPLSRTRCKLMTGLEALVAHLVRNNVQGELWIDGSFLTAKIDPHDVDLVLRFEAVNYENSTPEQREAIQWLSRGEPSRTLGCHTFCFPVWPEDHVHHELGRQSEAYWLKQWGYSRDNRIKGIAVVSLGGGTP